LLNISIFSLGAYLHFITVAVKNFSKILRPIDKGVGIKLGGGERKKEKK